MKYFNNFPYTAESLKKEFRAYSLTMHPDRGGNAEEFKTMCAEYEQVTNDLKRANEEAEAREEMARAAEEARRRREEEEREEEARKAAARPLYEKKCKKWAYLMEDLKPYSDAEAAARRDYGWSSKEAKAAGHAFRAARRRNLVAMAKAAFPGVKFTASINTGWGGGASISWNEGPTVEEFEAATNYEIFVSGWDTFDGMTDCAGYERADFTEFANNYGQFSGCVSFDRTETQEHRDKVADIICSVKPSAAEQRAKDGRREDCTVYLTGDEIIKICSLLDIDADNFKKAHHIYGTFGESRYFELFVEWFTKWSHYIPQPKAPEFTPKYGETYRRIKKALGGNVFGRNKSREILDIFALCDDLAGLEIGKVFMWEGKKEFSHMYSSSRKNDAARVAKMAAVGITLCGDACTIQTVADEVREALRREREDIERQRKEWEQAQQEGTTAADADNTKQNGTQKAATESQSNADGLIMEKYSEKATVIRGYNQQQRAELLEMGGRENSRLSGGKGIIFSTRKHGEALAEWFARYTEGEKLADTNEQKAPQAEEASTKADEIPAEPTAEYVNKHLEIRNAKGLQFPYGRGSYYISGRACFAFYVAPFGWLAFKDGDRVTVYCPKGGRAALESIKKEGGFLNLDNIEFIRPLKDNRYRTDKPDRDTDTANEPQSEPETEPTSDTADTLHEADEISEETQNQFAPVFGALADFLAIIADICTEAKKYEGITISPDILKRWRYEAEEGTKNIDEAFAEVCACLASLTPESRRDFDALGVIFWTLAEQLRNGCNADTISTATDYARGQLFDLIERTQTPQQAAAVREALNRHRPAA